MYKSCLWRKQNCRLSWMDTHSPELNCTATFIVSAWKNIPFFFFKFHTAKQVKNFTHQINDNLNKNLLKKPHHNNVLGPDHFKSVGPSISTKCLFYSPQAVFLQQEGVTHVSLTQVIHLEKKS